ncbi:substrate-binding domain-containing protein [Paracraurococcus lichenis]|uniref:Substrate-binding domain-containing protein n=1 Tax=Paracraurococcus lichenis TaxID=3064888 RepID=A0ABT9E8G9_9PROT|nr:substrate-binding domain-containing protein [Paracraurococcus sp. LOR1-02]MDO9712498.1 substrate-binding domain-containing protein [Paracraurococcus sp. LOR1-02]
MAVTRRILTFAPAILGAAAALGSRSARAQAGCGTGPQLSVYHAGSLSAAFTPLETLFTQQTGICVTDASAGSLDAARRVTAGGEPCDVYASADDRAIDLLLKPAGFADYTIRFARGAMVLAYTTNSRNAGTIAGSGTLAPPDQVPMVADDWYRQLTQTGVVIGSSHPFLDPSGYRTDMIFQLAEMISGVPNLYDQLLTHLSVTRVSDVLGQTYDHQFTYEHSARAAYAANPATYRFARLPAAVGLSDPRLNAAYAKAGVVVPGLRTPEAEPYVRIPASRARWGLTILRNAPNRDAAIRFLQLLLGEQGFAQLSETGPEPISPALVTAEDYGRLPSELQALVRIGRPPAE